MHKLMENIEKELHAIGENGFSPNNLDTAGKLVDMYKDLKCVESMGSGMDAYAEMSSDMPNRIVDRRDGARFDRNINELYDKYLWCKKEYAREGSPVHKEKVTKAIEALMSEICDLMFDIHRDCDFREEREIVDKYVKNMEEYTK